VRLSKDKDRDEDIRDRRRRGTQEVNVKEKRAKTCDFFKYGGKVLKNRDMTSNPKEFQSSSTKRPTSFNFEIDESLYNIIDDYGDRVGPPGVDAHSWAERQASFEKKYVSKWHHIFRALDQENS